MLNVETSKLTTILKTTASKLLTAALLAGPSLAMAQSTGGGLTRVKSGLESFNSALLTIIGVGGTTALLIAAIGYYFSMVSLAVIGHIALGLLIAAAATGIVGLFFPG